MTHYPLTTISWQPTSQCQYCGGYHTGKCPTIKAIEYYPDGMIKRVEFYSAIDCIPPSFPNGTIICGNDPKAFMTTCETYNDTRANQRLSSSL